MKKVTVIWVDAKSYANEWKDFDEARILKPERIETKGFLVAKLADRIIVAQSQGENTWHNFMVIPRGSVIKIK